MNCTFSIVSPILNEYCSIEIQLLKLQHSDFWLVLCFSAKYINQNLFKMFNYLCRDETGSLGDFVAELRDSLVVPLLLNPFEVLSINIKFMRRLKNEQIPG